jgi:hypothetical protein
MKARKRTRRSIEACRSEEWEILKRMAVSLFKASRTFSLPKSFLIFIMGDLLCE